MSALAGVFSGNKLRPAMESASLLLSQLLPLLFHHLLCLTGLRTIPPSGPICRQLSSPRSTHLFHPSFLPPASSHLLHFPFSQKEYVKPMPHRSLPPLSPSPLGPAAERRERELLTGLMALLLLCSLPQRLQIFPYKRQEAEAVRDQLLSDSLYPPLA